MTIQERADILYDNIVDCIEEREGSEDGYSFDGNKADKIINSALLEQDRVSRDEQREIDIQRVKELFRERICNGICARPCVRHMNGCGIENCIALNSIEQAMKGDDQ